MNALTIDTVVAAASTLPLLVVTPHPRKRMTRASMRPAHAAPAGGDCAILRGPQAVHCPTCKAWAGTPCVRSSADHGVVFIHTERRLAAGRSARYAVYGVTHALAAGWRDGVVWVRDSLAGDPRWARR